VGGLLTSCITDKAYTKSKKNKKKISPVAKLQMHNIAFSFQFNKLIIAAKFPTSGIKLLLGQSQD